MFRWYREINPPERRTFWSCFGGWGLDAMDVQMFSIALPALIVAFGLDNSEAGAIGSVTLVTSALGGWVAGALSDRYGRVRILQATIVWFSVCTFLCAFAQNGTQLFVLRALQGFGFRLDHCCCIKPVVTHCDQIARKHHQTLKRVKRHRHQLTHRISAFVCAVCEH